MNTLRLLLSVMVAITLVGCATTADNVTPASFRAAESVDNESCSTLDRSESAAVLSAAWQRCIAHYSTPNPSPVYNLMANQQWRSSPRRIEQAWFCSRGGGILRMSISWQTLKPPQLAPQALRFGVGQLDGEIWPNTHRSG